MAAAFAEWQPRYAARGVATFPVTIVDDDKKPSTRGYLRTGLRGSAQLAIKFADAESFGFACGRRGRITVVDMDSTDERIVAEGERLFGSSPLLWRTGGGKYAMAFRHNGEARRIRAIPGLPIDVLGGGFVIAPGSAGIKRPYEIIRGALDDLDRLPVVRMPGAITPSGKSATAGGSSGRIPEGSRNIELHRLLLRQAPHCDDKDVLADCARTIVADRMERGSHPITDAAINATVASAWKYEIEGRNWVGREQTINVLGLTVSSLEFDPLKLLLTLRGIHFAHPHQPFALSPEAMASADVIRGWSKHRYRSARQQLIDSGYLVMVHEGGSRSGDPSLFTVGQPEPWR